MTENQYLFQISSNQSLDISQFSSNNQSTLHSVNSMDSHSIESVKNSIENYTSNLKELIDALKETQNITQSICKNLIPFLENQINNMTVLDQSIEIEQVLSLVPYSYIIKQTLRQLNQFTAAFQVFVNQAHASQQIFNTQNSNYSEGYSLYNQSLHKEVLYEQGNTIRSDRTQYSLLSTPQNIGIENSNRSGLNVVLQSKSEKPQLLNFIQKMANRNDDIPNIDTQISKDPQNSQLYLKKANALLQNNQHNEAVQVLDQAFKYACDNFDICHEIGKILMKINYLQESIQCFKQATYLDPKHSEAYANYGKALINLNENESAIVQLDISIQLNQANFLAWAYKGEALSNLNCFQDAIMCFEIAYSSNIINNVPIQTIMKYGFALFNLQQYENSIQCYDYALNESYDQYDANFYKGQALMNLKKYQDAIRCFNSAISINAKKPEAFLYKGKCLQSLGKLTQAMISFQDAMKLDPNNQEYGQRKAQVQIQLSARFEQTQEGQSNQKEN